MRNRYFSAQPDIQRAAAQLYESAKDLPLVCPHGHVDPRLFADPDYQFGSPVDLLIIPDHYIFRMLYSQGIALESLGIPTKNPSAPQSSQGEKTAAASDRRAIWQLVCDNWHLFRATPTGIWIRDELADVFGITRKLNSANAMAIYDEIAAQLASDEFRPRALYERFNIEVLATTDAATDSLEQHIAIRESGWGGRIIPTFRPDAVVNIDANWRDNIELLGEAAGTTIRDCASYIQALEQRRAFFQSLGATATDHAAVTACTEQLDAATAESIFQRALRGEASHDDARRFTGHMLLEMARMSSEDGLVMQLHIGSWRNHNPALYARHGRDMGADMPTASEFTRNLKPLLDRFGNHSNLRLVLFNLDETTLSRELAPLAGHYPSLRLGPPWWFYDSWLGIIRYLDAVVETAGIYNLAGFNDDTRAYPSIPTRHDVWRRACAHWLAGQLVRGFIDDEDARDMMRALAYDLAKDTYRL